MIAWLVGCGSVPQPAAEPEPPPAVVIESSPPVIADAAAVQLAEAAPKEPRVRRNGDGVVTLFDDDPERGDDLAPVTMVLFVDLECPHCLTALPEVTAAFDAIGDARLVHKHFPRKSHPLAYDAARGGVIVHREVGTDALEFYFHDFVALQPVRAEHIRPSALRVGVAPEAFDAGWDSSAAKVDRDVALARELAIAGVPALFINCRPFDELLKEAAIITALEAELTAARQSIADGTRRDQIYARRCSQVAERGGTP